MKRSALKLVAICFAGVSCSTAPPMPDIEIKLLDAQHLKAHVYLIPKKPGEAAKYLRSEPITSLLDVDMHYAITPEGYVRLEEYVSEAAAWAEDHCK